MTVEVQRVYQKLWMPRGGSEEPCICPLNNNSHTEHGVALAWMAVVLSGHWSVSEVASTMSSVNICNDSVTCDSVVNWS